VTERDIVRALRRFGREHGRSPTSSEWRRARRRPAADTIIRHCGSWAHALAQMTPRERVPRGPGAEEIVARLRGYEREHGRPPTLAEWQRRRLEPSVNTIYRRFGSWPAALVAAGRRSPASIRTEVSSR
jgi:hypothetical protein